MTPGDKKTWRPRWIEVWVSDEGGFGGGSVVVVVVVVVLVIVVLVLEEEEEEGLRGVIKSPWMTTSGEMTHLPARMMCLGPKMEARREILLPVSVVMYSERVVVEEEEVGLGGILMARVRSTGVDVVLLLWLHV